MPLTSRPPVALSALLLTLASAAAAARECPTLQATSLGSRVLVLLGSRDDGFALPNFRVPGCGSRPPELSMRWTRDPETGWSPATGMPHRLSGTVFDHRGETWAASLASSPAGGAPLLQFSPLLPESPFTHVAALHRKDTLAVAVSGLDRWTFGLAEQFRNGDLLVESLTSHGPDSAVERIDNLVLPAPWPEGSRLLGVAGDEGALAVFARMQDGGVLAQIVSDGAAGVPAPFALSSAAEVIGAWLGGAPAAVVIESDTLELRLLEADGWTSRGSVRVRPGRLWAATSLRGKAGGLAAVSWGENELEAWHWRDGAWTQEEVPSGRAEGAMVPDLPPRKVPSATTPRRLVWALVLLAGLAGAVLSHRLLRRR